MTFNETLCVVNFGKFMGVSSKYGNINFRTIPANFSFAPLGGYVLGKIKWVEECNGWIGHARIWHISVDESECPEAHFRILPDEWTFFTSLYYSLAATTVLFRTFYYPLSSLFHPLFFDTTISATPLFFFLSVSGAIFFSLYFAQKHQRLFPCAAAVFVE